MTSRILLRRGTAAQWASANPILGSGELGVETDTLKFKIGNGTSTWTQLTSYANITPSDLTSAINGLINAAPSALDTLNELAAAINNDSSFSTTVNNLLSGKVSKSGGDIITAATASTTPLAIKAAASQTADLLVWQNNSGTTFGRISYNGVLINQFNYFQNVQGLGGGSGLYLDGSSTIAFNTAPSQVVFKVAGYASQTANLQEWQNSAGTALTTIDNNAGFYAQYIEAKNTAGVLVSGESQIKIASPDGLKDIRFWNRNDAGGLYYYNSSGGSKNILRIAHSTDPRIVTQTWQDFTSGSSANYGGRVNIDTSITTAIGMVIRGVASQTANLQEWQRSDGNADLKVTNFGALISGGGTTIASNPTINAYGAAMKIASGVNSYPMLIIQGAASQTANLQEWQNSAGTVTARFTKDGEFFVTDAYVAYFSGASNYSATLNVQTADPNYAGLVIRGKSAQTGDLQKWQNSAGTVLTYIDSTGKFTSTVDAVINQVRIGKGPGTGSSNMVFGSNALASNTTGSGNLAFGFGALQSNTTGSNNFVLGNNSLITAATGDLNMALGSGIMYGLTTGYYNVGIGYNALNGATTGRENMGIGISALQALTTGAMNTAIGQGAGSSITTSNSNVFIGYGAGANETGSNKLYIANSNTTTPLIGGDFGAKTLTFAGNTTVVSQAAATVGLIVKGAASQTANLTEWQDSSGNVLANVTSSGRLRVTAEVIGTGSYLALGANGGNAEVVYLGYNYDLSGTGGIVFNRVVKTPGAANQGLIIRGTASQTADLQQWQNSAGFVIARVDCFGEIGSNIFMPLSGSGAYMALGAIADTNSITVFANNAANKGLVVRAAASQTANLQEWQNSAGTVLSKIDATGNAQFAGFNVQNSATINGTIYTQAIGSTSDYAGNAISINSGKAVVMTPAAASVGLVVKSAASQTADLQQWQNSSGTVLAEITASGSLELNGKDIELMNIMGAF